ncbi:hypothetical protein [Citrobacter sp. CK204]|uniref:hypothetical protein n=1 Tax=Citrobacter sp. CK204 TaxID=2985113 RepID=UPI0025777C42|nr:hypothetical protein [Citrobacter sp. CK204]MDM3127284.1 hypothetical protein [Citrobacter sp. CK204]
MTTITRERLLKIQQWRETYGPGSNVVLPAEEAEELARIALASLDDEIKLRPVGVMSESAFHRLERSESRFIALWPRPGIYLPRPRPDDGVIVYAKVEGA